MTFLLVARQKKNIDTFQATIERLRAMGHVVHIAVQEDDAERAARASDDAALAMLHQAPTSRSDAWRTAAPLLRRLRDWLQYLDPDYAGADTLRLRVVDRLCAELGVPATALGDGQVPGLGRPQVDRLKALVARVEATIPNDPLDAELLQSTKPDVVLVTPGVHFGSAQADLMKAAKAAGIPVWMLLFSWDNLSTKGALHVEPDLMFVWNSRQRDEATRLHGFPRERTVAIGAPRFDEFFSLKPVLAREAFFAPLGLAPSRPTLLYLCSSRLVAKRELPFIERWLAAVRASGDERLRGCNVLVRPHPDIPLLQDDTPQTIRWAGLDRAQGWVSRPFLDDRAIVLRTTYATAQAFYECLYHSVAVVGLNTSAELEAGIVGRPVFTVAADDEAVTGQTSTLHFHYLLREHGGFVVAAPTLGAHVVDLAGAVAGDVDTDAIRTFIGEFLRPRGERPVADVLAGSLAKHAAGLAKRADVASTAGVVDGASTAAVAPVVAQAEGRRGRARSITFLRVGYRASELTVEAAPDTLKRRSGDDLVLDPHVVEWIDAFVEPNQVVYEIGAGQGEYSLVVAAHRNATAVAFEPGFEAYRRLCSNVARNNVSSRVVPLSIALGERTHLAALQYARSAPGESDHLLLPDTWRQRPYDAPGRLVQPVCAERLDDVVGRFELPKPHHLRVHVQRTTDAVLSGAADVLREPTLRTVFLAAPRADRMPAIDALLAAAGFRVREAASNSPARVFERDDVTSRSLSTPSTWRRVRQVFSRSD